MTPSVMTYSQQTVLFVFLYFQFKNDLGISLSVSSQDSFESSKLKTPPDVISEKVRYGLVIFSPFNDTDLIYK